MVGTTGPQDSGSNRYAILNEFVDLAGGASGMGCSHHCLYKL
ncbi:hypothetical protein [Salmonella enterica]|nr:hypothetical protein [Salmonella enterica]